MRKQKMRKVLGAVVSVFVVVAVVFFADVARSEYPERPVTIMVGFAPGGLTDIITRALAVGASSYLKQPIVIENKGGGGGAVALGVTATTKPDGYSLCMVQNASIVDTALMQKVSFKPLKSFTPVTTFAASEHSALLVRKDAPWQTIKEFLDYAKQNPGKIKYSTTGVGTGMHVAMEVVAKKDGIKWVHIPCQGGVAARTALMGEQVHACSYGVDFPPFVQSGDFRVLATHGSTRSPHFPDVPTFYELGYDFRSTTSHCIVGPAGLPAEVVSKLETAIVKGMETPEFKTARERLYLSPLHYNSKELDRSLRERWTSIEKLFKDIGLIQEAATQPE